MQIRLVEVVLSQLDLSCSELLGVVYFCFQRKAESMQQFRTTLKTVTGYSIKGKKLGALAATGTLQEHPLQNGHLLPSASYTLNSTATFTLPTPTGCRLRVHRAGCPGRAAQGDSAKAQVSI